MARAAAEAATGAGGLSRSGSRARLNLLTPVLAGLLLLLLLLLRLLLLLVLVLLLLLLVLLLLAMVMRSALAVSTVGAAEAEAVNPPVGSTAATVASSRR